MDTRIEFLYSLIHLREVFVEQPKRKHTNRTTDFKRPPSPLGVGAGQARARSAKKSSGPLLSTAALKYAFIADHRHEFPVGAMCQALDVSPSGYYAWRRRPKSQRQQVNEALVEKIKVVHKESRQINGSPRITEALQGEGLSCGHNRLARLMKAHGLRAKMGKVFGRPIEVFYNPIRLHSALGYVSPAEYMRRWAA